MEPLNNLEPQLNRWKPLDLDKSSTKNIKGVVNDSGCDKNTRVSVFPIFFSFTPHPPWSPQEINLAKIPNFIIEFIPLTSPAKIEKINQIYKQ